MEWKKKKIQIMVLSVPRAEPQCVTGDNTDAQTEMVKSYIPIKKRGANWDLHVIMQRHFFFYFNPKKPVVKTHIKIYEKEKKIPCSRIIIIIARSLFFIFVFAEQYNI